MKQVMQLQSPKCIIWCVTFFVFIQKCISLRHAENTLVSFLLKIVLFQSLYCSDPKPDDVLGLLRNIAFWPFHSKDIKNIKRKAKQWKCFLSFTLCKYHYWKKYLVNSSFLTGKALVICKVIDLKRQPSATKQNVKICTFFNQET